MKITANETATQGKPEQGISALQRKFLKVLVGVIEPVPVNDLVELHAEGLEDAYREGRLDEALLAREHEARRSLALLVGRGLLAERTVKLEFGRQSPLGFWKAIPMSLLAVVITDAGKAAITEH